MERAGAHPAQRIITTERKANGKSKAYQKRRRGFRSANAQEVEEETTRNTGIQAMGREQTSLTDQRAEQCASSISRALRQLSEEEIERRWQQTLADFSEREHHNFVQTVHRCHRAPQQ